MKKRNPDIEFYELLMACFKYGLNIRVTRYILWRYACNETLERIAELDGKGTSYQAVSAMIRRAQKKIKILMLKNDNFRV